MTSLRLVYGNWRQSGETATAYPISVKASVEVGGAQFSSGTLLPVNFSGARTVSIGPAAYVVSDPIIVALAPGATIHIRSAVSVAMTGQSFPIGGWRYGQSGASGESLVYNDDTTDDSTNAGGGTDGYVYSPVAVLGDGAGPSIAMVGDSIMEGAGDQLPFLNIGGFLVRALGNSYAWVRTSQGGETAATFAGTVASALRSVIAGSASNAVVNYGTNDIGANDSLATIQANLLTIWTRLASEEVATWQTTILPRVSSTDGFRTLMNQTLYGSVGMEAVRVSLNEWLRAGAPILAGAAVAAGTSGSKIAGEPGHPLKGAFDVAATVESSTNSGKFKVPGADDYTGTLTTGGSDNLVDSTKSFPTTGLYGGLSGHSLYVTGGTGAGQFRQIFQNTATQLDVVSPFTTPLDTTSTYVIYRSYTADGIHPSPRGHAAMATAIATGQFVSQ